LLSLLQLLFDEEAEESDAGCMYHVVLKADCVPFHSMIKTYKTLSQRSWLAVVISC
jgi:hypothetical protein